MALVASGNGIIMGDEDGCGKYSDDFGFEVHWHHRLFVYGFVTGFNTRLLFSIVEVVGLSGIVFILDFFN